ncbi:MAG: LD-carboxypeptidase [Candidatus Methylomirabilales bacterium]
MGTLRLARPRRLRRGDRVRLVAPAGPFAPRALQEGQRVLEGLGLVPVVSRAEFARDGFLAGSDRSRAQRLTAALEEAGTRAVWCIRGGYGTARLLPLLRLPRLRRQPKLLIGFSDVTALLLQLAGPEGFVTVHGPVVIQLPRLRRTDLRWIERLLFAPHAPEAVPLGRTRTLVAGRAEGRLVAGNLCTLASLAGTRFAPDLRGAILCIEDVNEEAYALDRLVCQVASAGMLRGVRGIVLGELTRCTPTGSGPHSARRVVERAVAALGLPAVSGAAFGHGTRHVALPLGVRARLDASAGSLTLLEAAVA